MQIVIIWIDKRKVRLESYTFQGFLIRVYNTSSFDILKCRDELP